MTSKDEAALRRRLRTSLTYQKQLTRGALSWWSVSDAFITGLPDTMGVYKGLFWALEAKAEDGRASRRQKEWLAEMAVAGAIAGILRAQPAAPGPMHAHLTLAGEAEPRVVTGKTWLLDVLEEAISKGVYKTDRLG